MLPIAFFGFNEEKLFLEIARLRLDHARLPDLTQTCSSFPFVSPQKTKSIISCDSPSPGTTRLSQTLAIFTSGGHGHLNYTKTVTKDTGTIGTCKGEILKPRCSQWLVMDANAEACVNLGREEERVQGQDTE